MARERGIPAFPNTVRKRIRLDQTLMNSEDPSSTATSSQRQRLGDQDVLSRDPSSSEVLGPTKAQMQIQLGETETGGVFCLLFFFKKCFPTVAKHRCVFFAKKHALEPWLV